MGILWRTFCSIFNPVYSQEYVPYKEFRTLLTQRTGISPEEVDSKVKRRVITLFGVVKLAKVGKIADYYKKYHKLPWS